MRGRLLHGGVHNASDSLQKQPQIIIKMNPPNVHAFCLSFSGRNTPAPLRNRWSLMSEIWPNSPTRDIFCFGFGLKLVEVKANYLMERAGKWVRKFCEFCQFSFSLSIVENLWENLKKIKLNRKNKKLNKKRRN